MAFAYHMEALRKQRVIERKNAARDRILIHQDEKAKMREEQLERQRNITFVQEQANAKERDYYLRNMGRSSGKNEHEKNYIDMVKQRQEAINRNDFRHQARELRDNCLYMGPVNEYFMA